MSPSSDTEKRGIVYTFYSFKGGVGRSMALANAAALLAKWGHRVLVVDWDLEAPGLERFFAKVRPDIREVRKATPGIVDLVQAKRDGADLSWRDCVIPVDLPGSASQLSLLSAGRNGEDYTARLHSLDFQNLFDEHCLGAYLEEVRNEWLAEFDFVLVDSRTGVTDIGGICTVHLADILVLVFTATGSSTDGARQIVDRARRAQEQLPLDRGRLLALPLPARDESRTEYQRAAEWKGKFAELFGDLYRDWLPAGRSAHDAIEQLRIPYVPFWSFGEELPVVEEGTTDPLGLGRAYEVLARFLAARLDWSSALEGQTLAPPPRPTRRKIDPAWLERHRKAALRGLAAFGRVSSDSDAFGKVGYTEVHHFPTESLVDVSQSGLRAAAMQAQIHVTGWPVGVVLENREEFRPRPTNEGVLAIVETDGRLFPRTFDYWTLTRSGDFYSMMSFLEDVRHVEQGSRQLYFDARIVRATEILLHCAKLYTLLGVEPNTQIELSIRYGGLRNRTLASLSPTRVPSFTPDTNLEEDEVTVQPISFRLGALESDIVRLVKSVCEPLFVVFNFAAYDDLVYRQIVGDFVMGKVS